MRQRFSSSLQQQDQQGGTTKMMKIQFDGSFTLRDIQPNIQKERHERLKQHREKEQQQQQQWTGNENDTPAEQTYPEQHVEKNDISRHQQQQLYEMRENGTVRRATTATATATAATAATAVSRSYSTPQAKEDKDDTSPKERPRQQRKQALSGQRVYRPLPSTQSQPKGT